MSQQQTVQTDPQSGNPQIANPRQLGVGHEVQAEDRRHHDQLGHVIGVVKDPQSAHAEIPVLLALDVDEVILRNMAKFRLLAGLQIAFPILEFPDIGSASVLAHEFVVVSDAVPDHEDRAEGTREEKRSQPLGGIHRGDQHQVIQTDLGHHREAGHSSPDISDREVTGCTGKRHSHHAQVDRLLHQSLERHLIVECPDSDQHGADDQIQIDLHISQSW